MRIITTDNLSEVAHNVAPSVLAPAYDAVDSAQHKLAFAKHQTSTVQFHSLCTVTVISDKK